MTAQQPRLVISGATGVVGGLTARRLAAEHRPLRLLARDPAKAPALPDCQVAHADFGDPDALGRGLNPGDIVFMVSINVPHDERMRLHSSFIAAAERARVAQLLYLSFASAGPEAKFLHARSHFETEELIRASGLPYTFLRTCFYDTVTTMFYLDNGLALGPGGSGKVEWVSRPDCAAAVAAVMLDPLTHAGKTYDINGPEALTLTETSELITAETGFVHRYIDGDYDPLELAKTRPFPSQFLAYRRTAFLAIAAGEFAVQSDDLARLTGSSGTRLLDFVREHRSAYAVTGGH